jgi:hypothetical protein
MPVPVAVRLDDAEPERTLEIRLGDLAEHLAQLPGGDLGGLLVCPRVADR